MSNNFLTPTDCKIRKIKDLGAIKNSLEKEGTSLFDRDVVVETSFTKIFTKILTRIAIGSMRAAAASGVFVFAPPLGVVWHLANCVYYIIVWIKGGDRAGLIKHIVLLWHDIMWSSFYFFAPIMTFSCLIIIPGCYPQIVKDLACSGTLAVGMIWATTLGLTIPILTTIALGARFDDPELSWLSSFFDTSFSIPLHLKKEFGLVGEDGWLLTFNKAVDDITVEESKTEGCVVVSGYFNSLSEEQAREMLRECEQVINTLQLELTEEEIEKFSKNPASFLPYIQDDCKKGNFLQFKKELESSVSKIDQLFKNYTLISGVLDMLLRSHKIKGTSFPYGPGFCRPFFSLYTANSQSPDKLLEEFNKKLAGIKGMTLGGPDEHFIDTMEKILDGTNPYDILGLAEGVSESEYKKAYFKSVRHIHPDKLSLEEEEEWKRQGDELFKVMNAAYKYVISTQKTHQKPVVQNSVLLLTMNSVTATENPQGSLNL